MLRIESVRTAYGAVVALDDVSFEVPDSSITAVLGANGAGKSTLLRTISGLVRPRSGGVFLDDRDITRAAPEEIARLGVAHVPEDRGLFFGLTGREHLRLATRRTGGATVDDVLDTMPHLREVIDRRAGRMSGGEQQMLALARALVARPRLLMVDELSLGLAPIVVQQLLPLLRSVAADLGIGVLLVEQYVAAALAVADRAHVLFNGRVTLAGDASALRADQARIARSYLGQAP